MAVSASSSAATAAATSNNNSTGSSTGSPFSSGAFQINGIVSGLDTQSIIQDMVAMDEAPINSLNQQVQDDNQKVTTWQSLNTRLLALQTATTALTSDSLYTTRKAATSDQSVVVAAADPGQDVGTYDLTVKSLATRDQQVSQGYADPSDSVGTGTVTIKVGTASYDPITIDSSNDTLQGLADAINSSNTGVTASIVDTGSSAGSSRYRLVLDSPTSGTQGAMSVNFQLSGGTSPTLSSLQQPADAQVQLGSGANAVTVTSSSNNVSNFLPGVSLNLVSANPNETVQLTLAADHSSVQTAVQNFISQYNQLSDFFSQQFSYDSTTGSTGTLFGSTTLMSLQSQLNNAVTSTANVDGKFKSLAQIGIGLDAAGHLSITDQSAFNAALNDPSSIEALLNDPNNGIATVTNQVLKQADDATNGTVAHQESSIQDQISSLKTQTQEMQDRVNAQESLLQSQFANMEQALAELKSQSAAVTAQLNSMDSTSSSSSSSNSSNSSSSSGGIL